MRRIHAVTLLGPRAKPDSGIRSGFSAAAFLAFAVGDHIFRDVAVFISLIAVIVCHLSFENHNSFVSQPEPLKYGCISHQVSCGSVTFFRLPGHRLQGFGWRPFR